MPGTTAGPKPQEKTQEENPFSPKPEHGLPFPERLYYNAAVGKKPDRRALLEILGLFSLITGLIYALILPRARIPAFLLFFLVYGLYLRAYRRRSALGVFFRFHLLELILFPATGLLSGVLFSLLVLLLLGGKDYGVPMVSGLIVGLLALVFSPPLFFSVHCALVVFVRRLGFIRETGLTEALRLSLLSAALFLFVSVGLKAALSYYFFRPSAPPEILSGPEITFRPLPGSLPGAYALLEKEFLHRRKIISYTLALQGEKKPFLFKEEIGERLLFYTLEDLRLPPEGALLRLETVETYPFLGKGPGPIYELPIRFGAGLPAIELTRASWVSGRSPGLRLELEAHLPQELLEVCLNFGGRLTLVAGRGSGGRELRFEAWGGRYLRRGKEEYLCYQPRDLPEPPVLGPFSVFLPMSREDFEILRKYGLARTGFSPVTLEGLFRTRLRLPVASGKPLEERFHTSLPLPHAGS